MSEDIVSHEINNTTEINAYAKSIEAWANPITRRDYFELLDENDFLDMTQRLASMVRGGNSNEQQDFDGSSVRLMGVSVPDQREKEELLRQTWDATQEILKDRSFEDREALELAGLTVAGGVLLAHPFIDGNGRTSRALSYLIARGNEDTAGLEHILAENSGGGAWFVSPSSRLLSTRQEVSYPRLDIDMGFDFAGEGVDAYGGDIANADSNEEILNEFIHMADEETLQLLEPYTSIGEMIDGKALLNTLADSPRAIEYRQRLNELMRKKKTETLTRFLDTMRSSEPAALRDRLKSYAESESGNRIAAKTIAAIHNEQPIPLREQVHGIHRAVSSTYDKEDNSAA